MPNVRQAIESVRQLSLVLTIALACRRALSRRAGRLYGLDQFAYPIRRRPVLFEQMEITDKRVAPLNQHQLLQLSQVTSKLSGLAALGMLYSNR